MNFKTEQEDFWASDFGNDYINRNKSKEYLASNIHFFANTLKRIGKIEALVEFGANIGMNLRAINQLYPNAKLHGIEINKTAATTLSEFLGKKNVSNVSIFDYNNTEQFDVSLIKGVLIHINPDMLPLVYEKLYNASKKHILVCEYYNPSPVTISYRGHENKLFKRDFAGEMMEKYPDLKLIDYGFVYRKDPAFPQDDVTWFLLSK
jgi:pseudaminic acid biosynthesis-associated methylase